MPKSNRHQYAARKAAKNTPPKRVAYVITDPSHTPDLRGEFAGVKVKRHTTGEQIVHLTDRQAKFHIDSGSIRPLDPPAKSTKAPAKSA